MKKTLERVVGDLLRTEKLTVSLAESCTGGLVSHRLTNIPGSSEYFLGGIVAYSNQAKVRFLGVSWDLLNQHGAVSSQVVLAMALGARLAFGTDLALSISGIAGPAGESDEKTVGTTWLGLSAPEGQWSRGYLWQGSRLQNKSASARAALQFLLDYLQGQPDLDLDLN